MGGERESRLVDRRTSPDISHRVRSLARENPAGPRNHAVPTCVSRQAGSAGIPRVADLNDLDENLGMAPSPANIDVEQGSRWNSSFAYLDPVRGRQNLTIAGDATVDR